MYILRNRPTDRRTCAENREARLVLAKGVLVVHVNAGDVDFFSGSGAVDQVAEQDDILVARHSPGRNRPRRLYKQSRVISSQPITSLTFRPCKVSF